MNTRLFWTGITMQVLHLFGFMCLGLTLIDWNLKLLAGIGYTLFNIVSLIMIFAGAIGKEEKE